jgi:uncharacterized oxidoreductase
MADMAEVKAPVAEAPPGAVRVSPEAIRRLIVAIMEKDGCSEAEAVAVADHLVDATATGHDSHGVIRVPRYHAWTVSGTMRPRTAPRVLVDAGSLIQLDGCGGVGQWLANEALAMGVERARALGLSLVALRRAGHIGRLGAYAEAAAREGLVSIQLVNATDARLVAPFGAAEKALSTAPVSVGVPNPDGGDFILDFATSVVAEGKVLVAAQGGKALPAESLIDSAGRRTADPEALYGDSIRTGLPDGRSGPGAIRAMGEHKGSGLALACELLAGALTGNGTSVPPDRGFGNGWLLVLVDPARLDNPYGFSAEVASFVDSVRGLRPDAVTERVIIPGDKERATRAERLRNGLPLPERVLNEILTVAGGLSLGATRAELAA